MLTTVVGMDDMEMQRDSLGLEVHGDVEERGHPARVFLLFSLLELAIPKSCVSGRGENRK